jgi:hypothetical protein
MPSYVTIMTALYGSITELCTRIKQSRRSVHQDGECDFVRGTFTRHQSNFHQTSVQLSPDISPTFTRHQSNFHQTSVQLSPDISPTFTRHQSNFHQTSVQLSLQISPTFTRCQSNDDKSQDITACILSIIPVRFVRQANNGHIL